MGTQTLKVPTREPFCLFSILCRVVQISEDKIAVCKKTAGLRSGNSSDFGLAYLKVFVPVIFQFSDMHNENRFLDTFRGLNIRRAGARTLIGGRVGVYIHIFRFCPTSFFCNKVDFKRN